MWALDLGTSNTLLARWDAQAGRPALVDLPQLSRAPATQVSVETPRAVPSAVHVLDAVGLAARLGFGKRAHIGRPALELNAVQQRPQFVPSFKRALGRAPLLTLARTPRRSFCARDVARLFLRELFAEARAVTGERIRDLVVASPVEAFETYRAEVAEAAKGLGVRRVRFVDEPVAAALGYAVGLSRPRLALVVDFGGGTLHVALVRLDPAALQRGGCEVLAKAGRDVGGDLVDRWLLQELCRRLDFPLDDDPGEEALLWRGLMLADARRVKEAVFFQEKATFELAAPDRLRSLDARLRGDARSLEVGREDVAAVLRTHGLYSALEGALDEVLAFASRRQVTEAQIDDVLMVGGSTLLPGIYPLFETRFGRAKVRAWHPFDAVALGACVFAAGQTAPRDYLVHDYALETVDLATKQPVRTIIVPRGTSLPTPPDLWKRQVVPTCSLGQPEKIFALVVCEVSEGGEGRSFGWDEAGRLRPTAEGLEPLVVRLNAKNPALGHLDPPHPPSDTTPRLELSFGVDADRWLCATVLDLKTRKLLMKEEPVVRLL